MGSQHPRMLLVSPTTAEGQHKEQGLPLSKRCGGAPLHLGLDPCLYISSQAVWCNPPVGVGQGPPSYYEALVHPQKWSGGAENSPHALLQGGGCSLARDRDHRALGCPKSCVHRDHAPDIRVPSQRLGCHK